MHRSQWNFVQSVVIVPRHTLEQELYEIGYTPDRVLLEHQENGFISRQLIGKWATDLVFPRAIHTLEFAGDFGNTGVFKSQITNHRTLFEPRHLVRARSQKLEGDDILH
jgi:hypothetical protein